MVKKGKKRALDGDAAANGAAAAGGGSSAAEDGIDAGTKLVELLGDALGRFYTQKNCRLHTKLLGEVLKRQPMLGWTLAPTIIKHVGGARDSYLSGEACAHVEQLLQLHAAYLAAAKAGSGGAGGPVPSPLLPIGEHTAFGDEHARRPTRRLAPRGLDGFDARRYRCLGPW